MIAGGYDVGIRAGEARDGTMVMREVAPLNFVVCGAPSYLAERGIPSTTADLSEAQLPAAARPRSRRSRAQLAAGAGKDSRCRPPSAGNFLANDITTLVTAAVHGQGLVFAPLPLVLPLFRTGALRPVLPECVSQPARIFIHYVSRRHLARTGESFREFHARASSQQSRFDIGSPGVAGAVLQNAERPCLVVSGDRARPGRPWILTRSGPKMRVS